MMQLLPEWQQEFMVGAYDSDLRGEIKLSRLTGYIQETAWWHADHLNFGSKLLHQDGLVWVLSAIKIHIDYYPKWMDKITIETWPNGFDRFFYLRDFVLYDKDKNVFGIASTQWLLLDIQSFRPKILKTKEILDIINEEKKVFEEPIEKLPKIEAGEEHEIRIDYTDYDLNRHVNSNRYVDFVLGSFDLTWHENHRVTDFQLNFLKEIKYEDRITLRSKMVHPEGNLFIIQGNSFDEKTVHFQSFVGFD